MRVEGKEGVVKGRTKDRAWQTDRDQNETRTKECLSLIIRKCIPWWSFELICHGDTTMYDISDICFRIVVWTRKIDLQTLLAFMTETNY